MGILDKGGSGSQSYTYVQPQSKPAAPVSGNTARSNSAYADRYAAMEAAEKGKTAAAAKAAADAKAAKAKADAVAKAKADKIKADAAARSKATAPILTNSEIAARALLFQADHQTAKPEDAIVVAAKDSGSGGSGGGTTTSSSAVKVATPDIITIDQETLPAELMTSLIFENIGGQELISLSRHDLISGSNMDYQSIKNLSDIYINHNSLNIIPMPDSSTTYAKNFPIDWEDHIIEEFTTLDSAHISINPSTKELQLLVANMKPGEQIEVEVLSSTTSYGYTKGSYYPTSF